MDLPTAKVDQGKFDVMELHARPELAAQQRMVDDASGDIKVKKKRFAETYKYRQTQSICIHNIFFTLLHLI